MALFRKKKKKSIDDKSEYTEVTDHGDMGSLRDDSASIRRSRLLTNSIDKEDLLLEKLDTLLETLQAQNTSHKEEIALLKKKEHKAKHTKLRKRKHLTDTPTTPNSDNVDVVKDANELKEELLNPKAIELEETLPEDEDAFVTYQQFSRDVRRAFQTSTSFLVLLVLLCLGYYCVQMIDEYLPPFFWAVLLSIMLRKPKAILLRLSHPLREIENNENLGYFGKIKEKAIFLCLKFKTPVYAVIGAAIFGKISCFILGWLCWVPWFTLTIILLVAFGLLVLLTSFSKADSLDGFFTTILIVGFLFLVALFVFTVGFKAVTETGDFAFKIQDIVEQKIHDPTWGTMLEEYGITEDSISEGISTGREKLDEWATSQGYNITEIEETILFYGSMVSGNETDISDITVPINETLTEEEGSYMDYIDLDQLYEYYEMVIDVVDMEQVGSIAGSVGGVLFSSGTGIVDFFSSIIASLLGAVDVLLQFIVFIGALFFFMESDESFVAMTVKIVPVSREQQRYLYETIHQNIIQVFVTSLLLSFSHGLATLLYFSIFGLDFAYSSAFIVGAMALFPLTSPWLIYAPSLLIAYLHGSGYVLYIAIGLFVLEQAMGMVDEQIYHMIPGSSPYLTGIGLAVGVSTFGVQGILLGPMLIVTTKTLFNIFCLNVAQPESPKGKDTSDKQKQKSE